MDKVSTIIMSKIKIIEAGNELGLGGTENVIQLYSKFLNKDLFEVTVIGLYSGGERVKLIQDMGINVIILNGDLNRLAQLLKETDVFHWHGYGTLNQSLFNTIKENRPKLVIQTNVFGAYEYSPLYDLIDYDLYVSKMILIRRMEQDGHLNDNFNWKRKVLHNPIDIDLINSLTPGNSETQKFKYRHQLQDYFIIGRIGRQDNAKFDLITLDAFAEFSRKIANARFLLVGATPQILAHAELLNITDKLIIFENTPDLKTLLLYYTVLDIFLAASKIGESFGIVIAEAMTIGIPVVTISTPTRDNAQIELVDNGQTGLVVERDIEKIVSALLVLYKDEKTRNKLSVLSKQKVAKEYKANNIIKSMEDLIFDHLNMPIPKLEKSLILDFSSEMINDYNNRCSDLWKPDTTID